MSTFPWYCFSYASNFVDKTPKCDHLNKTYRWAVFSVKLKLLSTRTLKWYCLVRCTSWATVLSRRMKSWSVTVQMKATEQYFPVVLFIMLYKVVLSFESVDKILKCDHSNESYWAVLSCGAVYYAVQGGSIFWVCGWNPQVWPFKWKLLSSAFLWCCFYAVQASLLFESVNEILKCDHSKKVLWAALSRGAVYYAVLPRWIERFSPIPRIR